MSDEQTFNQATMSDRIQRDRHRRSKEFRRSAIARFILSHVNTAVELERSLRFSEIDPSDPLECHMARLETEILGDFQKLFGIDLLALLTQPEPDSTPPRPDTQSHQPNVAYVNTGPSSHRSHTYGNTYGKLDSYDSEKRPAIDRSQPASHLETMRRLHPVRLGDVIDGLRVVETFWRSSPEEGDVPCYKLQGEREPRVFTKPISSPSPPSP
jgi:hypothetical protein